MPNGRALVLSAIAEGLRPPRRLTVPEWAERERYVSEESGSPHPGRWSNALVPYMVEPMACMTPSDPCEEVILKKAHQIAGTEGLMNLVGYVIAHDPSPVLWVLPTLDELTKFNRIKLQPTIEATPALKSRVREQKGKSGDNSTGAFKRFPGGYMQVTGANSSKGLQMLSARVLVGDEISEWPLDAGGRGDPLAQAEYRLTAWKDVGTKAALASTPDVAGACRITSKYEASDQRRYYVPCPHCGDFQPLEWRRMGWRSDTWPHGAYFDCMACGTEIEHRHKRDMVARGIWLPTFDGDGAPPLVVPPQDLDGYRQRPRGGRQPGFALWQAYSLFVTWDHIVADWLAAKDDPTKLKSFVQQVLGESYEETGEAPDEEKLYERRGAVPARMVPRGAVLMTGAIDVQGDRLEYAVYAYGIGLTATLVDYGVIPGDPATDTPWQGADELLERRYEDWQGGQWQMDALGVDAGYLSGQVYRWVQRHQAGGRVFALDGRAGWRLPPVGQPKRVPVNKKGKRFGRVQLYPVGTWDLKSELYASLRKTIEGPDEDGHVAAGAYHFPDTCDREFFTQITAEYLDERPGPHGLVKREWRKPRGKANEQLDLAVYCRALVHWLSDHWTPEVWASEAAKRGTPRAEAQGDLARFWRRPVAQDGQGGTSSGGDASSNAQKSRVPKPAKHRGQRRKKDPVWG